MATETITLSRANLSPAIGTTSSHRQSPVRVSPSHNSNNSSASTSPLTSIAGNPAVVNNPPVTMTISTTSPNGPQTSQTDSAVQSSGDGHHSSNRCHHSSHHRRANVNCEMTKIRLTVLCAKNLVKRDFFSLPDPFCKISVDGTGQCHSTEVCKDTLSPKWNKHYDLYLSKNDSVTITVWNQKKVHKKQGAGFLGCVKIMPNWIQSLKDTGYQRLDLHKFREEDPDIIKGQIVLSMLSRDGQNRNNSNTSASNRNSTLLQNVVIADNGALVRRTPATGATSNADSRTQLSSYVEGVDDLPEGWTECSTPNGRIYYVNHVNRTTQWDRPTQPAALSIANSTSPTRPASSRSSGHSSSRHTHHQGHGHHHHHHHAQSSIDSTNSVASSNSAPAVSHSRSHHQRRSTRHRNYLARNQLHEAVLSALGTPPTTNPDSTPNTEMPSESGQISMPNITGFEMRTTAQGQVYFYNTETNESTWLDPRVPRQLFHMDINLDELVGPLGSDWEVRHTSSGRRPYYVDHVNRTTQFTDPRLVTHSGAIISLINSLNSSNASNNHNNGSAPLNESVAKTRMKKINSENILAHKKGVPKIPISQQLKRRNLVYKMSAFRQELQSFLAHSGHCRIEVSRDDIFEDSYRSILKMRPKDLRKRLMIKFRGEEGLDYGGITREWLYLLSHEMLNPYYGLFQYTRDDIYTLQINPDSSINPDHLSYFHFVGRVIGIAVFHGHYIDGGFTLPFYKMLLNKPITLEDIESVDPELYRSLRWVLDNEITNVVDMTFSVNHDSFGQIQVKELKPNGKDIVVTEKNKKEYVQLYVNFRFTHGIDQQFRALHKGFLEVIPQHLLSQFDEKELELVIVGLGKIDVNDWKQHTRLKHCNADSDVVKWFWRAVESYSEERRARLLQFVTGSSRVPLQGFKALQGSTGSVGPRLFTIHQVDIETNNLPKAHTCFNRIDIPPYESYEKLYEKLTQAIEETCGFAVE